VAVAAFWPPFLPLCFVFSVDTPLGPSAGPSESRGVPSFECPPSDPAIPSLSPHRQPDVAAAAALRLRPLCSLWKPAPGAALAWSCRGWGQGGRKALWLALSAATAAAGAEGAMSSLREGTAPERGERLVQRETSRHRAVPLPGGEELRVKDEGQGWARWLV